MFDFLVLSMQSYRPNAHIPQHVNMPLSALRSVARPQNGVGAFVLPCKRLDFHYCNVGGSSRGMIAFLRSRLAAFAHDNPGIEITVSPRPNRHPVVCGSYVNGRQKAVCVRGLDPNQIMQKVVLLRNANGEKLRRVTRPVKSINESVRGIWDPFHAPEHKI